MDVFVIGMNDCLLRDDTPKLLLLVLSFVFFFFCVSQLVFSMISDFPVHRNRLLFVIYADSCLAI